MVSIIVPCWGNPGLAHDLARTMQRTSGIEWELILVDNGGGTEDWDLPNVRIVKAPHNLGFSGGNNFGASHAKGDTLLFLNNDVIIDRDVWLTQLAEECKEGQLSGAHLVTDNDWTKVRGQRTEYLNGWCVMIKKSDFEKIGGWETGFGLGWFEDVWLSARATALGMKLKEVKGVWITHLGSKTIMDGRLEANKLMRHAEGYYHQKMMNLIPKRVVFLCSGNYPFSDESWEGKGTGGAEAALILLTRELAKRGWTVDVYNLPETIGEQNGVNYIPLPDFKFYDYADIAVIWRVPVGQIDKINSPCKIFFSCDQQTGGDFMVDILPFVDKVITISPFHRDYFDKRYMPENDYLETIDLGVAWKDYAQPLPKEKNKLLFCSVPKRGLIHLKEIWKYIKKRVPEAKLYITSDYTLWGADPLNEDEKGYFAGDKDVHFLGKVSRKELVKHQLTSEIMVYPCDYDENFCISAAECMAAGCYPVTSTYGALATTVGEDGSLIKGHPRNDSFRRDMAEEVIRLLLNPKELAEKQKNVREVAKKKYAPELYAQHFEDICLPIKTKNMLSLIDRVDDPKSLRVLDIGCGDYVSGVSIQMLAIPFKEIVGIDIYKPDLDKAKAKAFACDKVTFYETEILKWLEAHKKEKFDLICLFDIVEHFTKENGLKLLKYIEQMCTGRIIMFMPIGDHTLEANDGRVEEGGNIWQKHLSEWRPEEWKDLGYDLELLKGFHHSGILDAGWIYKDFTGGKPYMKKCPDCGQEFNSSYWEGRHRVSHGTPETDRVNAIKSISSDTAAKYMVKIILNKAIDLSVNDHNWQGATEIVIPYEQFGDICRIITDAYPGIIEKHEMLEP